jgi:hypothetical protein
MRVHRLVPDVSLPPYAFVPGRHPHPESDPAGHSYGWRPEATPLDPDRWWDCRAYLLGLDLFNGGFWWESHVQWEALWLLAGRKGPLADFLKGLIHLAAAGVKHREGRRDGARSHGRRAAELFHGLAGGVSCGLILSELASTAAVTGRHGWPDPPPVLQPKPFPTPRQQPRQAT